MGSASSIPADKHIVIVGAGYAGTTLALSMKKAKANYTIINSGDCFHHNIGAVRAVVGTDIGKALCIPLEPTFGTHFKQGKVVGIKPTDKKVTLESGEDIEYDMLVIATGTTTKLPFKPEGLNKEQAVVMYNKAVDKIKAANKVVLVGGGATGVETASEIATEFPDKQVTIVHSGEAPISNDLNEKSRKRLNLILEEDLKIKIILGEKVINLADVPEEGSFTLKTDKGTSIEADYVLDATGLKIQTAAYENGLSDAMEENGALKVNQFLQVEGNEETIFAIGDCTNIKENKLAFHANEQAAVLSKTIKSVLKGGKPYPYKEDAFPMIADVSLGPFNDFSQKKPGNNLAGFMHDLKTRDLEIEKTWKKFNQKFTV